MPRLIEKEALMKRISCYPQIKETVAYVLRYVPTVDAVEVVRCKDCKYCDRGNCTFWDDGYGAIVGMADFCSQGERRERDDAEID